MSIFREPIQQLPFNMKRSSGDVAPGDYEARAVATSRYFIGIMLDYPDCDALSVTI
jgi:hypothetical protein